MEIALLHNHYSESHLEEVKEEMKVAGAPTIRAIWMECYNMWAAVEGCHRIRAAAELGLIPEIEELDYDEIQDKSPEEIGIQWDGCITTIGEMVSDCYDRETIEF